MSSSLLKFSHNSLYLFYYKKLNYNDNGSLKLRISRSDTVLNVHVGSWLYVHQGRTWARFRVSPYHVGYKAGSFSATKKPFFFRSKKKKGGRDSRR